MRATTAAAWSPTASTVWFDTRRRWHPLLARGRSQYRGFGSRRHRRVRRARAGLPLAPRPARRPAPRQHGGAGRVAGRRRRGRTRGHALAARARAVPAPWRHRALARHRDRAGRAAATRHVGDAAPAHRRAATASCGSRWRARAARPRRSARLRLVYPRFSYLHRYLPAAVRRRGRADPLPRALPGQPRGPAHRPRGPDRRRRPALRRPRAPRPQYLDWLASWFGAVLRRRPRRTSPPALPRARDRLFATRGTPGRPGDGAAAGARRVPRGGVRRRAPAPRLHRPDRRALPRAGRCPSRRAPTSDRRTWDARSPTDAPHRPLERARSARTSCTSGSATT